MKCPCCDKELTAEVIDRVRESIALAEKNLPAPGSDERTRLIAMRALVEMWDQRPEAER
jgi:hypothetical protein